MVRLGSLLKVKKLDINFIARVVRISIWLIIRIFVQQITFHYFQNQISFKLTQIEIQIMNTSSPQFSKIKLLNDRWQQIQTQIDRQKHYRQQNLEEQLNILENKLTYMKPIHHKKTQNLLHKINQLSHNLQQIKSHKQIQCENQQQKIKNLQQEFTLQFQQETKEHHEKLQNWIKESDSKLIEICNSLQEVTNEKTQNVDMILEKLKKSTFDLEQEIQKETNRREASTTQLTENVEKQLNRLHSQLDKQRKNRQENTKKLFQMVRSMQDQIQQQIQQQKIARRQTTEALLSLLQQTCAKVEKAFG